MNPRPYLLASLLGASLTFVLVLLALAYYDPANQPCAGQHRESAECQ